MKFHSIIVAFLVCLLPIESNATFIPTRDKLKHYCDKSNVVMIASTGRSGSTMLTEQCKKYLINQRVTKTHLLPPKQFRGKIIFVFSNPDLAAESALFMTLHREEFGRRHFTFVETADRAWLKKLGGAQNQTEQENLLSYDALNINEHLQAWLFTQVQPGSKEDAQILAIKYEHLWECLPIIRDFLDCPKFKLPRQRPRGRDEDELYVKERKIRRTYNLGTEDNPRYSAYDDARVLWEQAPPYQYLKLPE